MSEQLLAPELKLNLIETIAKNDKFSTFSRLMGTSSANEIFSADGDFTVFAPTNDAFAKITDADMNALLNEPGQVGLKALLSYHVLPGILTATNIGGLRSTPTVTGADVTFSDTNGLRVNDSVIQARNIQAKDGIVHAINTVLSPPKAAAVTN